MDPRLDAESIIYEFSPFGPPKVHTSTYIAVGRDWYWEHFRLGPRHEVVLITGGACRLHFADRVEEAHEGDVVFHANGVSVAVEKISRENLVMQFCHFTPASVRVKSHSLGTLARAWPPPQANRSADCIFIPRVLHLAPDPRLQEILVTMENVEIDARPGFQVELHAHLYSFLHALHAQVLFVLSYYEQDKRSDRDASARWIARAVQYIETHLPDPLTPAHVALAMGLNADYLSRLFRKSLKQSLGAYILQRKMMVARARLMVGNRSVKQVAAGLGFTDARYFARRFKQVVGKSPRSFVVQRELPPTRLHVE